MLKNGDKVVITEMCHGHGYDLGKTVTIDQEIVGKCGHNCKRFRTLELGTFVCEREFKPVEDPSIFPPDAMEAIKWAEKMMKEEE